MKGPRTVDKLVELGRVQLSKSFFMRDFLFSDIATIYGVPNVPDDPDLAIAAGKHLCEELLEPLQDRFGRLAIRSAYRSPEVNRIGNERNHSCASNEANAAHHIWDMKDATGRMGATACVVVPSFVSRFRAADDWKRLAWWIHDHLPYSEMAFFPHNWAFNLNWHEQPRRTISSYIPGSRGYLTEPGMTNHGGSHEADWQGILP